MLFEPYDMDKCHILYVTYIHIIWTISYGSKNIVIRIWDGLLQVRVQVYNSLLLIDCQFICLHLRPGRCPRHIRLTPTKIRKLNNWNRPSQPYENFQITCFDFSFCVDVWKTISDFLRFYFSKKNIFLLILYFILIFLKICFFRMIFSILTWRTLLV